jgi:HEAT repeat protein
MSFLSSLFGRPDVSRLVEANNLQGIRHALSYGLAYDDRVVGRRGPKFRSSGARDRAYRVRLEALDGLVKLGGLSAVPDLLIAMDDPDERLRYTAIEALGTLKSKDAVPELIARLESVARRVDDLGGLMYARPMAIAYIGALRRIAAPEGTKILVESLGSSSLHDAAVEALAAIGLPAVQDLSRALENHDVNIQAGAARALGRIGGSEAVRLLVDFLCTATSDAFSADFHIPERERTYYSSLIPGADMSLRVDAAMASLKAIGRDAVAEIVSVLEQGVSDRFARTHLASILGNVRAPEVFAECSRLLQQDPDWRVRKMAATALATQGSDAIPSLKRALSDEHEYVRSAAQEALARLKAPPDSSSA